MRRIAGWLATDRLSAEQLNTFFYNKAIRVNVDMCVLFMIKGKINKTNPGWVTAILDYNLINKQCSHEIIRHGTFSRTQEILTF